ncbi:MULTISPECIES: hypothetical protein [unclassified Leptolyngbya]|uniref:hypothetical protein n=1 Tax=unclassified Leptolyngbya TaxID=2650499 RepID=UPI001687B4BA|nr:MULTISPECIES: hypothetical protein [unclassified Leptolyngbya]MBD1913619.1 hypothetical protein [Leptolyngbya sp. FACHB-8]MBD2154050.1 hypothetical protein [Leptolyngbya sp. FACHB-16]
MGRPLGIWWMSGWWMPRSPQQPNGCWMAPNLCWVEVGGVLLGVEFLGVGGVGDAAS